MYISKHGNVNASTSGYAYHALLCSEMCYKASEHCILGIAASRHSLKVSCTLCAGFFHDILRDSSIKNENSITLSFKLFQTCTRFFLLSSTKEDILKNVGN